MRLEAIRMLRRESWATRHKKDPETAGHTCIAAKVSPSTQRHRDDAYLVTLRQRLQRSQHEESPK